MRKCASTFKIVSELAICVILILFFYGNARAQQYPVIFNSASDLRTLGLSVQYATKPAIFGNVCYYYGDGGYFISFSDAFFLRFSKRGFSVEAVCLGLVSNTKFDPESGVRLPTYIIAERKLIERDISEFGKVESPGLYSDELPLDLPDCFRNGTPYLDCDFKFGRISGEPISKGAADKYRLLGRLIDSGIRLSAAFRKDITNVRDVLFGNIKGRATSGRDITTDADVRMPEAELRSYDSATIWARIPSLKHGYAYALDADGAAGPLPNPELAREADERASHSQVDVEELRRQLSQGQ